MCFETFFEVEWDALGCVVALRVVRLMNREVHCDGSRDVIPTHCPQELSVKSFTLATHQITCRIECSKLPINCFLFLDGFDSSFRLF